MALVLQRTLAHISEVLSNIESYVANDLLGGWTPADIPNLAGKTALVTGANSGIGFETARKLAENGAKVFMVSRVMSNGLAAADKIRNEVGKSAKLEVLECDLSRMENVITLVREFKRRSRTLDVLVNMAGMGCPPGPFRLTPDGLEPTLAANYYAPALLTLRLLDVLRRTPKSRVVFMASTGEAFGHLDWDNLRGDKYRDSGLTPYATSKMYLIAFSRELSVRVPEVDILCVQPGLVRTPAMGKADKRYLAALLLTFNMWLMGQTPTRGAWSTLYAATEPALTGTRWGYFGPNWFNLWPTARREPASRAPKNPILCWKLFEETVRILNEAVGTKHPFTVPLHPNY